MKKKFSDFINENDAQPMDAEKQEEVKKRVNGIKDKLDAVRDKLDTIKFSELDGSWSKPEDKSKYTGSKNLDSSVGEKVLEMLKSHGLTVICGRGDYLNKQGLLLNDEEKFMEHRVRFAQIITWEEYLENEGYYKEEDFEELSDEEQLELVEGYQGDEMRNDDGDMEFSVFLPKDAPESELVYLALSDATNYLHTLHNTIPAVTGGGLTYNVFTEYPEETTKFINKREIRITNKNLPYVTDISHRLYRDSKFFQNVEFELDRGTLEAIVRDWLKIS